jgi:hypothetical protein
MTGSSQGVALVIVMMAMLLLSALGLSLALTTSTETMIAANYREGLQGLYAADAALERALEDLVPIADWDVVLAGSVRSSFVDGPSSGDRTLADGSKINLSEVVNQANCGRSASCTSGQMDALTEDRSWGANNPRWRLFLHGPLSELVGGERLAALFYVLVMVADDPSETDGDPLRDAISPHPAAGLLAVRAEAFGPRGARRKIDATLARVNPGGGSGGASGPAVRLLSWRASH